MIPCIIEQGKHEDKYTWNILWRIYITNDVLFTHIRIHFNYVKSQLEGQWQLVLHHNNFISYINFSPCPFLIKSGCFRSWPFLHISSHICYLDRISSSIDSTNLSYLSLDVLSPSLSSLSVCPYIFHSHFLAPRVDVLQLHDYYLFNDAKYIGY